MLWKYCIECDGWWYVGVEYWYECIVVECCVDDEVWQQCDVEFCDCCIVYYFVVVCDEWFLYVECLYCVVDVEFLVDLLFVFVQYVCVVSEIGWCLWCVVLFQVCGVCVCDYLLCIQWMCDQC